MQKKKISRYGKKGSDIDLALKGNNVDKIIASLWGLLEDEVMLPYSYDLVDYSAITNKELKEHIDTYGKIIWKKQ